MEMVRCQYLDDDDNTDLHNYANIFSVFVRLLTLNGFIEV